MPGVRRGIDRGGPLTATTADGSGTLTLRGRLVTPEAVLADGVLVARAGVITHVGPARDWPAADVLPVPSPLTVLPGLVDVHCHGAAGHSFPDADADGARAAARHHRQHGTTALVASLVCAPPEVMLRQCRVLSEVADAGDLAGVHLEGPFLAPLQCGAQDPAAILPGDPDLLRALLRAAAGTVRSVTLAPETAHCPELFALLRDHGVLPSIGHTAASPAEVRRFLRSSGPSASVTHLFNGMPSWHHRQAGPVAACLAAAASGDVTVELVADGVHLDDDTVAAVFALAAAGHVALVTDATAAAGMPDGRYRLGALDVDVRGRVARLAPGNGTGSDPDSRPLAGGTSRLLDVLRRTVQHAGVDLLTAVRAASATPARLLGLEATHGALRVGARADVLVVDDDLRPVAVAVDGDWLDDTYQQDGQD